MEIQVSRRKIKFSIVIAGILIGKLGFSMEILSF